MWKYIDIMALLSKHKLFIEEARTYGKPPIPILKRDKSWKEFIKSGTSKTSHLTNKFSDSIACDGAYWKLNNPEF
jgi:hypothetical protein